MKIPKVREIIRTLVTLNSTPRGIALGVAIGVFIGITPLHGFHTVMVILAAMLVPYTNKIAILFGANIGLPPAIPFITWTGYNIGRAILGEDYPALEWSALKNLTYRDIPRLYSALLLGSIILGIVCATITYFLVLFLVQRMRNRKKADA